MLPCLAGLDAERQALYLDICAGLFLAFAAWLLAKPREAELSIQAAPASA